MASTITELFGYDPNDRSKAAVSARRNLRCPFLGAPCTKTLSDGTVSGVCTIKPATSAPVVCCPNRLYADRYRILRDIAVDAFGAKARLVPGAQAIEEIEGDGNKIAVFGKRWGGELHLPARGGKGSYFVDWILARISPKNDLAEFVAIEVQSIDTTGNYRAERDAYMRDKTPLRGSTANLNWENVSKRILPQLITKGHILRREPLCQKGLFFVCPTPVYEHIKDRLGGSLEEYHPHAGSLTMRWYTIDNKSNAGTPRGLVFEGQFTTTTDQVAKALTLPESLPPQRVYENAIRAELGLARVRSSSK